uniref:Sodium/potassium-transporting ATPase subunit beta n=1 Tax=Glossina brevipalpis TaxID=37001 RepID=A0A1A9WGW8_9MUSC
MSNRPFVLQKRFRHEEEDRKAQKEDDLPKKIFNVEEGQLFGRTPFSWFLIFLFIAVFWTCIALYWAFLYYVFASGLPHEYPRRFIEQPGFSYEPCIIERGEKKIDYHESSEKEIDLYTEKIFKSLTKYGEVPQDRFGECDEANGFGYKNRKPCFFLKVNKVIGFKVDAYNYGADMPNEVPETLKKYVDNMPGDNYANKIWISCKAEPPLLFLFQPGPYIEAKDIELDIGNFYIPKDDSELFMENLNEEERKISKENSQYFNQKDFRRIIAAHPANLTHNTDYSVVCQMWAKNIVQETQSTNALMNRGYIRFHMGVRTYQFSF